VAEGSCGYPACAKHKIACQTKKVGTCVMPEPGCLNKNAVCSLGRCNCPDFYCAVPGTKECVPQLVYEGARPGAFARGPWLRAFTWLGSPDQFPSLAQLAEHPEGLISPRCLPAVLLLFVGLAIAVVTGVDLCEDLVRCVFCKRAFRESDVPGETHQKDNITLVGIEWVDEEHPDRHKNETEPACTPVAALAAAVVVFSIAAVLGRLYNWQITSGILITQLDRLKGNAQMLQSNSVVLNYTASNLSHTFSQVANCSQNPLMSMIGGLAVNSTYDLATSVSNFRSELETVPRKIDSIELEIRSFQGTAVYLPCAPMLLMSLIAAGMLAEVLLTRYYGSAKTAKYEEKGLAVCAGVFVLIIAVVAVTCAALLSSVIGVAQQCDDIDTNVVEYLKHETQHRKLDPILLNITRHYLFDDVYNPLGHFADEIYNYVETVEELVEEYNHSIVYPQSLTCKPLNDLHVDHIGNVTKETLAVARDLFNATNIYPYYQEVVHAGICNHIPQSVGLFCLQQAVVGLIFFPLCACWTHNYLAHHVSAQRPGRPEASDDEDTEGVTDDADDGPRKLATVAPRELGR